METPTDDNIDMVSKLPLEVTYIIFKQLAPDDLRNAWNSCKEWRKLMNNNYFWKIKCANDDYQQREELSKMYQNFLNKCSYHWQGVYQYNQTLNYNWKNNIFRKSTIVSDDLFSGICYLDEKILIVTTINVTHKIKIINSSTGKVKRIFSENEDEIVRIFKSGDRMVSWSVNGLKVWNIINGFCALDIIWDDNEILIDVAVCKNLIAFGLSGGIFRIMNIDSGKIEYENRDEGSNPSCIAFHDDVVGIGKEDGTINIIDLNNYALLLTLECCERNVVQKIMIKHKYLICIFQNGMVRTWNLEKKMVITTFEAHSNAEAQFLGSNKFVCRGTDETTVQVWNLATGSCCFNIDNEDIIKFVTSNRFYIITGSANNGCIKMWCSRTGRFIMHLSLEVHSSSSYSPLITDTKFVYIQLYANKKRNGKILHILDYENFKVNKK